MCLTSPIKCLTSPIKANNRKAAPIAMAMSGPSRSSAPFMTIGSEEAKQRYERRSRPPALNRTGSRGYNAQATSAANTSGAWILHMGSGAGLTRPIRAYRALLPCAARNDICTTLSHRGLAGIVFKRRSSLAGNLFWRVSSIHKKNPAWSGAKLARSRGLGGVLLARILIGRHPSI